MRSNTDEFIAKKEKEFEKFINKIYKEIELWKLEFRNKIEELRRLDYEEEREHEQHLKDLEEVCNTIENSYKSNCYKIQHCRKEMLKQAKYDMRVFEQEKQTPRMLIEFAEGLINHFPTLFTVEYVKQPDYVKKIHPMRIICGDKSEFRIMSGCDFAAQGSSIYLADYINNQIKVVTKSGEILKPLKGVSKPWGVKVSKGLVFVTERDTGQLKVLNTEGDIKCIKKLGDRSKKNEKSVPRGVDVDKQGRVYIADSGLGMVHILDSNRHRIKVGEIKNDCLKSPQDVKVVGNRVYVLDAGEKLVKVFDRDGELIESLLTNEKKLSPEFFTVDRLGNMIICNQKDYCIEMYDDQGKLFHEIPCNLSIPGGIALRKNGDIIISCTGEEICKIF